VVGEPSPPAPRLSDLTRAHPADRTLQNLLGILNAKLDLCARLPIYEYEAASEGFGAPAATFNELMATERRSFEQVLACLREHLDAVATRDEEAV
jgi:hypothetical protein